ncbi:hypothetical protein [Algivirga pacifica]|uniref:Outer membrane protein beta-barrel domain-containing protein n=1 Tax=Algivirga pacifica TaxID=1162670 RepID=A0ABP9DK71_9BACT
MTAIPKRPIYAILFVLLNLFPVLTIAQDLKNLHLNYSLPLSIFPSLEKGVRLGHHLQLNYNLSPSFGIGIQYINGQFRDQYSGGTFTGFLSDTNDDIIDFIIQTNTEKNIVYILNSFGIVSEINIRPFKKFNPFLMISINYQYRNSRITSFEKADIFDTPQYYESMNNAQLGYNVSYEDPLGLVFADSAVTIPYKQTANNISAGLSIGIEWNINRDFSFGLQVVSPDLINPITLPNTSTVSFLRDDPFDFDLTNSFIFPNPEEEEKLKNNPEMGDTGYLGQTMNEDIRKPKLYVELFLTYKFFYKK